MNKSIQACVGIVSVALFVSTAKASNLAYAELNNGAFGTVDLGIGAFAQIGSSFASELTGLGVFGGAIYSGGFLVPTLYQIDPTTGAVTSIGTASINFEDVGSTLTGLFALDVNLNLYSVNAGTGATTLIGPTGLSPLLTVGMSSNSSTLYLTDNANLYSLNISTGAATLIGSDGSGIGIGAMVFESGTLYGGQSQPSVAVDSINTGTGATTFVTGVSFSGAVFNGLAPPLQSSAPEPATLGLIGGGLLGFAILGKRHRNNQRSGDHSSSF